MSVAYSPFVYWGQLKEYVSLKIDLRDAKQPDIQLEQDSLTFKAFGRGSQGDHLYEFHLDFYLPVIPKESQFMITAHSIQLRLKKRGGPTEIWPRLTHDQKKYPWLKIDFDNFASLDDDSDSAEDAGEYDKDALADLYSRTTDNYNNLTSASGSDIKSISFFCYYLLQLLASTGIFATLSYRYFRYGFSSPETTVSFCGTFMLICSGASFLELIASYLAWTRSNTRLVLFNVVRRNSELMLILSDASRLIHTPVVFFVLSNWCFLDILKYLHELQTLRGKHTEMLSWLYHTLWMPLYPLSALLSCILIMVAIPEFEQNHRFSLRLPNVYNVSLSFPLFLRACIAALLIGTY